MYQTTITVHIIISSLFILLGLVVVVSSLIGWIRNLAYTNVYNQLSRIFLWLLYVQLILGVMLYYFLGSNSGNTSLSHEDALLNRDLRYWVIEHFSVMIFTLALTQLGRLFILNNIHDKQKFKNTAFFYGISYLLIIISSIIGLLR